MTEFSGKLINADQRSMTRLVEVLKLSCLHIDYVAVLKRINRNDDKIKFQITFSLYISFSWLQLSIMIEDLLSESRWLKQQPRGWLEGSLD